MVERRKGGETGVKAVQTLGGPAMWKAMDAGRFSRGLLEETIRIVPAHAKGDYRELSAKTPGAGVILVEYRDGLTAAVVMLNGFLYEGDGGAFCFAGQLEMRCIAHQVQQLVRGGFQMIGVSQDDSDR